MTGQPTELYLSESAIMRAFATAEPCGACVTPGDRVLFADAERGVWGVVSRHATSCPTLTPEQRAEVDAFWDGLREHDAADRERAGDA